MTIVEQQIMEPTEADLEQVLAEGADMQDNVYDVEEDPDTDEDAPYAGNPEVAEWVSLTNHPAPTVTKIRQCLRRIASRGRSNMTILLLGRAGVGKSSTLNSLFAYTVAQAVPFHMITYQAVQPLVVRKKADGMTLTVIDTPGLIESDAVSDTGLSRVAFQTKNYPVDVVLFVDRLDMHKPDELDRQMMSGLSRTFGTDIWSRMVIGLTRADIKDPVPGQTYDSMITKRVEGIREIMRKAGGRDVPLPYVLIENSDRCQRNEAGEKVLENGVAWIPTFFDTVVDLGLSFPTAYKYNPKKVNRQAELFVKFCLIPLVLVAQVLFKFLVVDRIIEQDGLRGDQYGPYDQEQMEREKQRLAEMKASGGKALRRRSQISHREREMSLEDELSEESEEEEVED